MTHLLCRRPLQLARLRASALKSPRIGAARVVTKRETIPNKGNILRTEAKGKRQSVQIHIKTASSSIHHEAVQGEAAEPGVAGRRRGALDGGGRSRTANACSRGNAGAARRKNNSRIQSVKGEALGTAKAEARRIKQAGRYLTGCGESGALSRLKERGRLQLKHSNVRD